MLENKFEEEGLNSLSYKELIQLEKRIKKIKQQREDEIVTKSQVGSYFGNTAWPLMEKILNAKDEEAKRLAQEKKDELRKNIDKVRQELEAGRERRRKRGLWCDYQVQATDGTVQCVALLHEWKFFNCPYKSQEECRSCSDCLPRKGDQ